VERRLAESERSELLGLEFERSRATAIVERCLAWCREPRATHIILTANASHLCLMRRDASLREACRAADLAVADGMSVVWALGLLGRPVPERVAGIDLMTALLEEGSAAGLRVYFLGATTVVVEALVAHCRRRFPGLVVAGGSNASSFTYNTGKRSAISGGFTELFLIEVSVREGTAGLIPFGIRCFAGNGMEEPHLVDVPADDF